MNDMTGDVPNEVQRAMNRCADCGTLAQEIQIAGGWPLCGACAEAAHRAALAETRTWRDLATAQADRDRQR